MTEPLFSLSLNVLFLWQSLSVEVVAVVPYLGSLLPQEGVAIAVLGDHFGPGMEILAYGSGMIS